MKIFAISIMATVALAFGYWLRPRPSWWYLRDRLPDHSIWQQSYTPDQMPVVISALEVIVEAFLLRKDDVFKLRPEDKLLAIYRDVYPDNHMPDSLEFETLFDIMTERLQLSEPTLEKILAEKNDPAVQDIVGCFLYYSDF